MIRATCSVQYFSLPFKQFLTIFWFLQSLYKLPKKNLAERDDVKGGQDLNNSYIVETGTLVKFDFFSH